MCFFNASLNEIRLSLLGEFPNFIFAANNSSIYFKCVSRYFYFMSSNCSGVIKFPIVSLAPDLSTVFALYI